VEPPKRWRLTHVDPSEPAYDRIYLDGRSSISIAYLGFHPDGDPSGSLPKDGSSLASIPRIHPVMGYTRVATRVDPLAKWVLPRRLPNSSRCYFSGMSRDESSPTLTMRSQPITGPNTTAPRAKQQSTLDQHYDIASKLENFPIQVNISMCHWGTNPVREPYSKSF